MTPPKDPLARDRRQRFGRHRAVHRAVACASVDTPRAARRACHDGTAGA